MARIRGDLHEIRSRADHHDPFGRLRGSFQFSSSPLKLTGHDKLTPMPSDTPGSPEGDIGAPTQDNNLQLHENKRSSKSFVLLIRGDSENDWSTSPAASRALFTLPRNTPDTTPQTAGHLPLWGWTAGNPHPASGRPHRHRWRGHRRPAGAGDSFRPFSPGCPPAPR